MRASSKKKEFFPVLAQKPLCLLYVQLRSSELISLSLSLSLSSPLLKKGDAIREERGNARSEKEPISFELTVTLFDDALDRFPSPHSDFFSHLLPRSLCTGALYVQERRVQDVCGTLIFGFAKEERDKEREKKGRDRKKRKRKRGRKLTLFLPSTTHLFLLSPPSPPLPTHTPQAAAAATLAATAVSPAALAGEFDLLASSKPTSTYVIDDAAVLNRTTRKAVTDALVRLETSTGYRLTVATVRKLEVESDAFALGDKLVEHWYPTVQEGGNKGVLLLVTAAKDGALTGGPAFLKAVGDELIDSVVGDNIPILAGDEKFNEAVTSSVKRVEAKLSNLADPGPPARKDGVRKRTYKTKAETEEKRGVTGTIVLSLLAISVVVPMLQYYGYTSDD